MDTNQQERDELRKAAKKARRKAYREANREKVSARTKAYYEANREKESARKKARSMAKSERLKIILRLMASQRGKCALCHVDIVDDHHLDHVVPLALGGTNDAKNLQLLFPKCNLEKNAADPVEFAKRKGKLV